MSRSIPIPTSVELIQPRPSKPFHRDSWIYEEKYDGWRIVAIKDGPRVRLLSRTDRDHAARFPELAERIRDLPVSMVILDGEVCRFDQALVSRFHLLSEPDGHPLATPPVFMVFDCLFVRGRDLRPRPLSDRRKALEDLVAGQELLYAARRLAADGLKAWERVLKHGYEGLVAKDERAPYDPQRTQWLKVKVRREGRFVIGGVIAREDLRALLVGERDGPTLRYCGVVEYASVAGSLPRCSSMAPPATRRRRRLAQAGTPS